MFWLDTKNIKNRHLHELYESFPLPIQIIIRKLLIACKIKTTVIDLAQIALTYHCNACCYKCSIHRYRKKEKELSTIEVKSLIDQLEKIGTSRLALFGGETLLRKDIFELIEYVLKKGIAPQFSTNGYFLSKETARKLKDAGLCRIEISIDSSDEKTHDKLRNLPGCFKRAVKGVEYCVANGMDTSINVVATKKNIHDGDLNKVISLGRRLRVDGVNIILPTLSGCWFNAKKEILGDSDYEIIYKLKKSKFRIMSEAAKIGKHFGRFCRSRILWKVYISPYGEVQPCWAVPINFGNIREKPLKDIFKLMKEYDFNTNTKSYGCIANDSGFRTAHLKHVDAKTVLPIKIYNKKE